MVAESKQIRYKFYYRRHWLRESYVNWNCVCCVHYTPFGYCFLFGKLVTEAVFFRIFHCTSIDRMKFQNYTNILGEAKSTHIHCGFVCFSPPFLLFYFVVVVFLAMLNTRKVIETCNTQGTNTQLNNSSDFLCPRETNNSTKQNNNKKKERKRRAYHTNYNNKYKKNNIIWQKRGSLIRFSLTWHGRARI